MLINENILRDSLREAIADVADKSKRSTLVVEKQLKEMALHMFNMTGGEMAYILNGRTPVDTMSDETMFKIAFVLYKYIESNPSNFDIQKIDVDKYFTDSEKALYSKKIDRKSVDKDRVFKNYIKISDDQYIITLTNKEITELLSIGKVHYNPETQRELTEIQTENGIIKKVTIIESAFNAISDNMIVDEHIPDAITWNINPDIYPMPKITKEGLYISEETFFDCTDGYHRTKAIVYVTKMKPEWERTFFIVLTVFDVNKAKKYIIQENYKNPLSEEQATEYDLDNTANFVVDKLKQSMYLKDSNIDSISFSLNKMITKIFNPERLKNAEARKNALNLFKLIEGSMNSLIERNDWIGKEISKEEWFIYLYLIDYCNNYNKKFDIILSKININNLLEQIKITNEPTKKHFKIMGEVINNV